MRYQDHRKELLRNADVAKEFRKIDLAFELSKMLIAARDFMGFTQVKLAKALRTKQSSIARLENGQTLPSLSFLDRIAKVYKTELVPPRFAFLDEDFNVSETKLDTENQTHTVILRPAVNVWHFETQMAATAGSASISQEVLSPLKEGAFA